MSNILRKLKVKDIPYMLEWMHDKTIARQYKTRFEEYSEKQVQLFIENSFSDDNKHWAYVDDNDEYLGTISLKNISKYNKNAEMTYAFRSKVRFYEIRDAINLLLDYASDVEKLTEVYSHVFEEDHKTIELFKSVGLVSGGTYVQRYELLGVEHKMCWFFKKFDDNIEGSLNDVIHFNERGDERGHMVVIEQLKDVPFEIKRLFYIYGSDADVIRGQHANRKSEFVLINVCGSSKVRVTDGTNEKVYSLDKPHMGVYIPKMIWKDMYDFSKDSVLLVLSNELYDATEYIRDYDKYVKEMKDEE